MEVLLRISRFIDVCNERIGKAAAWLGLAAVIICTINAIFRYTVNMSSNAWLEIQWYLNAAVFLLVAAWALKRNDHVRIDVIISRLSLRAQAWIDILGGLLALLPAAVIIAWYSWPMRLLVPVAFSLLALQGVSEIIKRIAFLKGLIAYPAELHRQENV